MELNNDMQINFPSVPARMIEPPPMDSHGTM